ncbi:Cellulose-binding protein [Gammaproteobacteria bacterium]
MVGGATTANATANSGLAVSFTSITPTICTVNGTTVSGVSAGTCTIAANQVGNANYFSATQVTKGITVSKGNQNIGTITLNPNTLAVGRTTTVNATASSGLTVSFTSTTPVICTVNGTTVSSVSTGTCVIAANQAGNTNYLAATQVFKDISVDSSSVASAILQVSFSIGISWSGGYSGTIEVKNLSSQTLPSGADGWRVILKFPDAATAHDVFQVGPWNFQIDIATDGTTTLFPTPWATALSPGGVVSSGFNGVTPTVLRSVTSGSLSQAVVFASSVPDNTIIAIPRTNTLFFSPYKDVTMFWNWGTKMVATGITGTVQPLLTVIPAKLPAITWAFATGECGSETWARIQGDTLAQTNVQAFADANVNYVISTGGSAGIFTCSTVTGMNTFINRYASKNLVGIDFDIERGQTQAQILGLVEQTAAVQSLYPDLRFSFTIATVGSSNGRAASNLYGDLNATGDYVIQAIKQQGLSNYTINLMTMDYGAADPGLCVVVNGVCDMGKTAIQSAKNLKIKYNIPYDKIELTPMIGMNDITDEIFSLTDIDTITEWALANNLAGIHFWSFDRDMPCSQMAADPTCSSVSNVPALGYTNRFITDLGL